MYFTYEGIGIGNVSRDTRISKKQHVLVCGPLLYVYLRCDLPITSHMNYYILVVCLGNSFEGGGIL